MPTAVLVESVAVTVSPETVIPVAPQSDEEQRRICTQIASEGHVTALIPETFERTDVPVKQIAFRVGYSHVTNFINAFSAQFGRPPSHFRKSKAVVD